MPDTVIKVENLSKQYRIGAHEGYKTFRETLVDAAKAPIQQLGKLFNPTSDLRPPTSELIWALKDVSFEVKKGEVVGIIGRNGAGKSTLLKILSQITEPTEGRVELRGRVGSLLEVGTGFHPELTGHENVYLYGAILGMDRWEVTRKFDEIVAFAEIEKFIDTPVKRYSSGMYMRLAFAVAAHMDTEILLVDEVLAVGDAGFQKKCLGKMGEVATKGRTVIFVSHNMSAVTSLCNDCVLIDGGRLSQIGRARDIVSYYLAEGTNSRGKINIKEDESNSARAFRFMSVLVENNNGEAAPVPLSTGVDIQIVYRVNKTVEWVVIVLELWDSNSNCVLSSTDMDALPGPPEVSRQPGDYIARCLIPPSFLRSGRYYVSIWATVPRVRRVDEIMDTISFDIFDDCSLEKKIGQGRRGVVSPLLNWETEKTG